jgi:predicted ATPase/class 3 adenylate cyclase
MPYLPIGTITLLFTDMEGSTRLLAQLRDAYTKVLADYRQLLRAAFEQWHGCEVDTQGDAFFVAFARTSDAVAAAVASQRALARHSWPEGVTVQARLGLHTGEPQVTAEGYIGIAVHHSARIMSAGHGGQIVLSQTTRELVEAHLPAGTYLEDLGEHRLKDLDRPTRLYQLSITDLPAAFPPLKTLDTYPSNLPIQPTAFIGREQEMAAVAQLLRRPDARLVTLTGTGGVGKTRLGLQVAADLSDRFADGVFLVTLAPVSDPEQVVPAIAQTLGIREAGDQPLLPLLHAALQDKQLLLLLDNFERVTDAAVVVAELLASCPKLKVLVTSRVSLHVRAEHEFAVPPLALPIRTRLPDPVALSQYPAVALFIDRAQAVKPDFAVTNANAPAVAGICARLDGLPLAIELAAARVKYLSPQTLLTRLEQGLGLLAGGARDLPARQQTLRGAIAWSYDLLAPAEQALFRRFAIFVDGATWAAAESVCSAAGGPESNILEGLASLVDKSLLRQAEQTEGEARFRMLQLLREFGLEQLAKVGELEATRAAHAAYYLALAEEAHTHRYGAQAGRWLKRLDPEHENLRAALQWALDHAEVETAVRLGWALWRFWTVRGYLSEGRTLAERALAASAGSVAPVRAKALLAAGILTWYQSDHARLAEVSEEALVLCQQLGDQQGVAYARGFLAEVALHRRRYAAARALLEEALTTWREIGDSWMAAFALMVLGRVAFVQGEHPRAQQLLAESLARYRAVGYQGDSAWPLLYLARLAITQGDDAQARALVEEALVLCQEMSNTGGIAYAFGLLGQIALAQGDVDTATARLTESLQLNREVGNRRTIARSLYWLAGAVAVQGDAAQAQTLYEESLGLAQALGHQRLIAAGLRGLAAVVSAQGQPAWAAQLWGAAAPLPEASDPSLPPVLQAHEACARASARRQMGEARFAATLAVGRTLTPQQALVPPEPLPAPPMPAARPFATPPAPAQGGRSWLQEDTGRSRRPDGSGAGSPAAGRPGAER